MRRSTRGAAAIAAAGAAALVLAACGTGRDAPTSLDLPSVPGVNVSADDGSVLVRNATVAFSENGYATGGTAPVTMWLVNTSQDTVRLVEVTSEQASAVSFDEVELGPTSLVPTTLEATGLNRRLDASTDLSLTLVFDNGAEIPLQVTIGPPEQPLPREPMTFEDGD